MIFFFLLSGFGSALKTLLAKYIFLVFYLVITNLRLSIPSIVHNKIRWQFLAYIALFWIYSIFSWHDSSDRLRLLESLLFLTVFLIIFYNYARSLDKLMMAVFYSYLFLIVLNAGIFGLGSTVPHEFSLNVPNIGPNQNGFIALCLFLLAMYVRRYIVGAFLIVLVFMSGSMVSISLIPVLMFAMLFFHYFRFRNIYEYLLKVFFLAGVALSVTFYDSILEFSTLSGRVIIWKHYLNLVDLENIQNIIWGVPGEILSESLYFSGNRQMKIHSAVVSIFINSGLLGLFLFYKVVFFPLKSVRLLDANTRLFVLLFTFVVIIRSFVSDSSVFFRWEQFFLFLLFFYVYFNKRLNCSYA
jgi:hypothetical protein